eukprot:6188811-Pleurochrysis_carterae.AAC.2
MSARGRTRRRARPPRACSPASPVRPSSALPSSSPTIALGWRHSSRRHCRAPRARRAPLRTSPTPSDPSGAVGWRRRHAR